MGLNEVIQEIMNNARKEASEIEKQAREETSAILARAKQEIAAKEQAADEDFERVKDSMEKRAVSSARLESKKALHNAHRQLLEQVFSSAYEKIEKMDAKTREALLKKIASSEETKDIDTVYANKKDAKAAATAFKSAKIKETDILGGAILENADNTVRIDRSFDQLLATVKENKLKEVSEKLFQKAK